MANDGRRVRVLGTTFTRDQPNLGFPIGWYTALNRWWDLPPIAGDGMTSVMPYHNPFVDSTPYLDAAQDAGVKVLLELPRGLVRERDAAGLAAFVAANEAHPALLGWYLADEPSTTEELGPLSAADAAPLYTSIKQQDPMHPVAIAFGSGEQAEAYQPAMDVMMWDEYPANTGTPEFYGFTGWANRMAFFAEAARTEQGFIPIIQAIGGTESAPLYGKRFPTAAEERYMAYTALQMGANGLFFWTHDLADRQWVGQVLVPIVAVLKKMQPALAAGERTGLVTERHNEVHASTFRDPSTGRTYIVAVHHGEGSVSAPLSLHRGLRRKRVATLLSDPLRRVRIRNGRLRQILGPFEVKVYRIR